MPRMLSDTTLFFFAGSSPQTLHAKVGYLVVSIAVCVILASIVLFVTRAARFVRMERAKTNAIEAQLMVEALAVEKDTETTPE